MQQVLGINISHTGWWGSLVGLSTVPYTARAVLFTVSIQPFAVLYLSHIHEVESPHRYSTVITSVATVVTDAFQKN